MKCFWCDREFQLVERGRKVYNLWFHLKCKPTDYMYYVDMIDLYKTDFPAILDVQIEYQLLNEKENNG